MQRFTNCSGSITNSINVVTVLVAVMLVVMLVCVSLLRLYFKRTYFPTAREYVMQYAGWFVFEVEIHLRSLVPMSWRERYCDGSRKGGKWLEGVRFTLPYPSKCYDPCLFNPFISGTNIASFMFSSYHTVFLHITYFILPGICTIICNVSPPCEDVDLEDVSLGSDQCMTADYSISCDSDRYWFA